MKSIYPLILAASFLITPKAHAGFGAIFEWIVENRPKACQMLDDASAEELKSLGDIESLREAWGCNITPEGDSTKAETPRRSTDAKPGTLRD